MGRPKKAVPPVVEPEEESQEIPEDEPERFLEPEESIAAAKSESRAGNSGKSISGAEAVRQAMADGRDSPGDIADYAFEKFGLTIPKTMVSSYKSQEKARQVKKSGGVAAPAPTAPAPKSRTVASPVQAAPVTSHAPIGIIADLSDIKRLLATHGRDGLEELIKVLS